MPIQKDLKKIVRARMEKTGEAYTTARLHIVSKKAEPLPDYEALAGMSNAALKKATGRGWAEWVAILDAVQATKKTHGEIAQHVFSLGGVSGWWSQGVTVGYERIRGLRDIGQRRGGTYEANKSRTFAVPVEKLFKAFANARTRNRWLDAKLKVRTVHDNKTIRASFDDGTLVQFYFMDKGNAKSSVTIQHQKLADKNTADKTKQWWTERLDALAAMLG
ncbi:MAG: hypothetical protein M3P06_22880 [Acidobacteriota bacterium]|nr:hypothetical protein [Acidobacteriota bacterium]